MPFGSNVTASANPNPSVRISLHRSISLSLSSTDVSVPCRCRCSGTGIDHSDRPARALTRSTSPKVNFFSLATPSRRRASPHGSQSWANMNAELVQFHPPCAGVVFGGPFRPMGRGALVRRKWREQKEGTLHRIENRGPPPSYVDRRSIFSLLGFTPYRAVSPFVATRVGDISKK